MAMNIAGFCLVNWMKYGLSFVKGSGIHWLFSLSSFIIFATVPWLPESPQYVRRVTDANQPLANRKLEDMDIYFRENPSIIVINDKDATKTMRLEKYALQDHEDIQRERVSPEEKVL
ncbi:hypothetical protein ACHAP5_005097 [Fusarium lateritium]